MTAGSARSSRRLNAKAVSASTAWWERSLISSTFLPTSSGLWRRCWQRLAWVVVERFDQARAAVTFLQERGAGAATFLPLECLSSASDPLPEDDGVRWIGHL